MQAKELWFTENYCPDARFSMRVERQVYSAKSRFQQIDVYDTPAFGRVLVLDELPDADREGRVHLP